MLTGLILLSRLCHLTQHTRTKFINNQYRGKRTPPVCVVPFFQLFLRHIFRHSGVDVEKYALCGTNEYFKSAAKE